MFLFLTAKHSLSATHLFREVVRVLFLLSSLSFTVLFPSIDHAKFLTKNYSLGSVKKVNTLRSAVFSQLGVILFCVKKLGITENH